MYGHRQTRKSTTGSRHQRKWSLRSDSLIEVASGLQSQCFVELEGAVLISKFLLPALEGGVRGRVLFCGAGQINTERFPPTPQKKHRLWRPVFFEVELEGIEPSSKQGDHKLSTCLVQFWFSWCDLTWTIESHPYPLKFRSGHEAAKSYSRICRTAYLNASGRGLLARCLVPMSNKGIKRSTILRSSCESKSIVAR